MVAKSTQPSSSAAASSSKPKSSSQTSKSTSLVQSSAKRTLKKAAASKKKSNKFRDSEKRELLDGQTSELLASAGSGTADGKGGADPFSYGAVSREDQRRTRRQADEAALALDMLMKS
ncbi:conserved hypothetical protein [Sporisorium reilianum SRZ2]|uniref:Uncharacterized protein n=2 Tax=Sporisorium reilianum TaxID=72558 RepID=E6ZTB2_SPORE|nr:conserved hypothetical protein [Sporisorium reilianum SRZ2]SJX61143.1 uncharacterized protein SRS1_12365 [Sporisorium reilianum f. sp. reilianum]